MLLTATQQVFSHPPAPPPADFQFCVRCHGELIIIPIKEKDSQQYRNHKICGCCGLPVDVQLHNYTPRAAAGNSHEPPIVTVLQDLGARGSAAEQPSAAPDAKADLKIDAKAGTSSSFTPKAKRDRREG